MRNIFTYGGRPAQRNMTVADLRECKGVRKLTQTNPATAEEAAAAVEAGFDTLICGRSSYEAVRAGAPHTFLTVTAHLNDFPTDEDTQRGVFRLMEAGADAIYAPRRPELVKMLADEGVPVIGHLGLVPRKCTWVGGLRAVGRTAEQAKALYAQFCALEDAGAFGVEIEVIPEELLGEINQRTSLITFSLGSGSQGDVTYLFASDILGENEHPPRHAKAYANFRQLRADMQAERVRAFTEFVKEVHSGVFPTADQSVSIAEDELAEFKASLK